ncbi:GNAT family N-acetyltransferase [Variovorax sp. Root434]|uniref:GNAT family N-acetyltransferase n=1 Tax=Variovorax sp. Root434 TaxID=1736536 RepID=UPI000AFDC2E9|nr:GNAT family N-acetyltransferase [Variovorax sp. Root434]
MAAVQCGSLDLAQHSHGRLSAARAVTAERLRAVSSRRIAYIVASGCDARNARASCWCRESPSRPSSLPSQGLGTLLFERLIEHARRRGIGRLVGFVLRENTRMLKLSAAMGFRADPSEPPASGLRRMVIDLLPSAIPT